MSPIGVAKASATNTSTLLPVKDSRNETMSLISIFLVTRLWPRYSVLVALATL